MLRITDITQALDYDDDALLRAVAKRLCVTVDAIQSWTLFRRSVDARKKSSVHFKCIVDAEVADEAAVLAKLGPKAKVRVTPDMTYRYGARIGPTGDNKCLRPVVVGLGPCGMFAGLLLAQMGLRPLVLERGKKARARAKDVFKFWETGEVDARSNVAFGEGGAGTFSDGKLTTQTKDRGNRIRKVLEEMVEAGAPSEILYAAKPHIGTYKLIKIVRNLRAKITALGGEVRFETQVTDLLVEDGTLRGLRLDDGTELAASHIIFAIGHSARDTFEMLLERGVHFERKPFSIGARIEHPQGLVNVAQHGPSAEHPRLGAADYKLVHHCANGRSAYSFCMCPGGQVIAATSEAGQVVTNGMSYYSRAEANANAGLVVGVTPDDFAGDHPLAGVAFQREWEERAFAAGGRDYRAPAQRIEDFLAARASQTMGEVTPSYQPGVTPADLAACLPPYVIDTMREAIGAFDKKLRGYALPDAVLTGVETRTSSPVRMVRGADFQSVSVAGLYPAGEGAGYAGGIMTAAVDGIRCAEAVAHALTGAAESIS